MSYSAWRCYLKIKQLAIKWLLTFFVVLACYGSVQIGRYLLPKLTSVKIDAKYLNRSKGDPKAPLWIIEYLDFQCTDCRESLKLIHDYMAAYPKEIYLQVRYYPLIRNHAYALKSAVYAECACLQNKFWEYSDKIFASQDEWGPASEPDAIFERIAVQTGIDAQKMKACVKNPATEKEVLGERQESISLGSNQTPTFFMNGKKIDGIEAMKIELKDYFLKKRSSLRGTK